MTTLLTTATAARTLGIAPRTLRQTAAARNIGTKLGRDWVFTLGEVAALAVRRKPGRKAHAKSTVEVTA